MLLAQNQTGDEKRHKTNRSFRHGANGRGPARWVLRLAKAATAVRAHALREAPANLSSNILNVLVNRASEVSWPWAVNRSRTGNGPGLDNMSSCGLDIVCLGDR
jgi:hypothetical protein